MKRLLWLLLIVWLSYPLVLEVNAQLRQEVRVLSLLQAPATPSAPSPGLRFNGVYQARNKDSFSYLRFYDDGTVVGTSETKAAAQDVTQLLNKCHDERGRYQILNSTIEFLLTSQEGITDYKGMLVGNRLKLQLHDRIYGDQSARDYEFVVIPRTSLKENPTAQQQENYDGSWKGLTSQGTEVAFTIKDNQVQYFELAYKVPGKPCFAVETGGVMLETISNAFSVGYSRAKVRPEVICRKLSVRRSTTAGGINASPVMYLNGTFSGKDSVSGDIRLTVVGRSLSANCQSQAKATWRAHKDANP